MNTSFHTCPLPRSRVALWLATSLLPSTALGAQAVDVLCGRDMQRCQALLKG